MLEEFYQGGLSQPTDQEINEVLEKIGKDGESGLLLSKNMIGMWFKQRRELPKMFVVYFFSSIFLLTVEFRPHIPKYDFSLEKED